MCVRYRPRTQRIWFQPLCYFDIQWYTKTLHNSFKRSKFARMMFDTLPWWHCQETDIVGCCLYYKFALYTSIALLWSSHNFQETTPLASCCRTHCFKLAICSFCPVPWWHSTTTPLLLSLIVIIRSSSEKLLTLPRVNFKSAGARASQYHGSICLESAAVEYPPLLVSVAL